jgi:hypothetical protein
VQLFSSSITETPLKEFKRKHLNKLIPTNQIKPYSFVKNSDSVRFVPLVVKKTTKPQINTRLILSGGVGVSAQVDFDHYLTFQSKGSIPSDFSDQTFEKIEEGMTIRRDEIGSQVEQREFLEKNRLCDR